MKRSEAEKEHGVGIYQGGAIPGKELRIVNIKGIDVEACGGTHLDNTKEAGKIIIISSERIQDNISRITFACGDAASKYEEEQKKILKEVEDLLSVKSQYVVVSVKNLFEKWKKLRKQLEVQRSKKSEMKISDLEKKFINDVIIEKIENSDLEQLQSISKTLSGPDRLVILFGLKDKLYVFVSAGANTKFNADDIVRNICKNLSGKGGGRRDMAQGIITDKENLESFMEKLRREIL